MTNTTQEGRDMALRLTLSDEDGTVLAAWDDRSDEGLFAALLDTGELDPQTRDRIAEVLDSNLKAWLDRSPKGVL